MSAEPVEGDIVQITDSSHPWFPCLLTVTEPKPWGIQGFVTIPNSNDGSEPTGRAFNRLNKGQYEVVGKAVWMPG